MTTKCFVSFETSGRCLLSALFLICSLASANVFGEPVNPDKLAQLGPQAPVQLAPVTYHPDLVNTPLTDGDGIQGTTQSANIGNPATWEYYRFCANAGDTVSIETHRTTSAADPTQMICLGTTDDSAGVSSGNCGPMVFVDWADDNNGIPHGVGGDWADPKSVFAAPESGEYTLMVFDFLPAGSPPEFEIHVDGVVECDLLTKVLTSGPDRDPAADYPDFDDISGLTLNGDAAQAGSVLRLTPAIGGQAGSAFTTNPITLGPAGSFNTHFSFKIMNSTNGGADGLAFLVQNDANTALGAAGGNIGYSGITPSLAVEFDSWLNGTLGDPDGNHVGTATNGGVGNGIAVPLGAPSLDSGTTFHAWIDYDGLADLLEVRLSTSSLRPVAPTLSQGGIGLAANLGGTSAYVGFTSGTGAAWGDHDVLSWQFSSEIDLVVPIGIETPTAYDFTITYNDPDGPPVWIYDQVPAEWDVTHIEYDDDGLPLDCGEDTDFEGDYGMVDVWRGGKSGKKCQSDTGFRWMPDPSQQVVTRFYWTNGWTSGPLAGPQGTVNRVNSDGTGGVVLATTAASGGPLYRVTDVEIDQARNALYFTNWHSGPQNSSTDEAIYRTDLNGAGQIVFNGTSSSPLAGASGLHRLAVDPANGDVYFTRAVSYANPGEVSRVDVNGGAYTQLIGVNTGWFFSGVALDNGNGLVYFGDGGVLNFPPINGALNVMTKAGAAPAVLVPWGGGNGMGKTIAVDANAGESGTVFYSGWDIQDIFQGPAIGEGDIWAYDVDSGVSTLIYNDDQGGIPDIEVDPFSQRIYWTDYVRGEIRSAMYDGDDVTVEVSGLQGPFGLALEFEVANDTLNVQTLARCHDNKKNKKCKPTSCGALYLNYGAIAYEKDEAGNLVLDHYGDPVVVAGPTQPICLAAVDDINGDGTFTWDGSGDEDGDDFSDYAEACFWGNDPCVFTPDDDGDGIPNTHDNCVDTPNPGQEDYDNDGVGDACDNCMFTPNSNQADYDLDGVGDVCDNCIDTPNPNQEDYDWDGVGDVCDNCDMDFNPGQEDADGDGVGDACDNCVNTPNADQSDVDGDDVGDVCDNCPDTFNPGQEDSNGNGIGDACDVVCDTAFVCGVTTTTETECLPGSGAGCFCVENTEGDLVCHTDQACAGTTACTASNQCGVDESCLINTCCNGGGGTCLNTNVCADPNAPVAQAAAVQAAAVGEGLTSSGRQ